MQIHFDQQKCPHQKVAVTSVCATAMCGECPGFLTSARPSSFLACLPKTLSALSTACACAMATRHLELLLSTQPRAERVVLSDMGIADLSPLLNLLSSLSSLRELDLQGNTLTGLPTNLSMLQTVESLDLTRNQFRSVEEIIPCLLTMPSLETLSMTLSEEEEEEVVVRLPKLM
jgi:hypothetical protein